MFLKKKRVRPSIKRLKQLLKDRDKWEVLKQDRWSSGKYQTLVVQTKSGDLIVYYDLDPKTGRSVKVRLPKEKTEHVFEQDIDLTKQEQVYLCPPLEKWLYSLYKRKWEAQRKTQVRNINILDEILTESEPKPPEGQVAP